MVTNARPTRAAYYKALADNLPAQALVVTALGNASYLWASLHHERYIWISRRRLRKRI